MTAKRFGVLAQHVPNPIHDVDGEWTCGCGASGPIDDFEPDSGALGWGRHVVTELAGEGCVIVDVPPGEDLGSAGRQFDQTLASISIRVAADRAVFGINPGGGETPLQDATVRALFADAAAIVAAATAAGLAEGGDDQ